MKAKEFIGIIPPLLSSFTKEGEVYEKGIREIVRFTLPYVNGYYPIGTYGCGPLMSLPERKKVLEIIIDEVNGKVPVVAHVGTADTNSMIDLAKHAKSIGASGVGAVSPYYAPNLPDDALFEHFKSLIDAVNDEDFPVFVYNNQKMSQNTVSPQLLKKLADYGLRGCKDSSFDLVNFYFYQDAVADYPDFNLIVGTEAIFIAAFESGATGSVCGMGNIFPKIMKKMYDQYNSGDKEAAMETQRLILKIRKITKLGPTIPIMHYILRMKGIDPGYPRKPYINIDSKLKINVQKELEKLDLN
jgi:dihydrodipicolinate synthase/N-acetylneuraminate lyase